ncbi:MAG: hypothetical protein IJ557_06500 [Bacteroidaceae bacterium]|nr:hypothetical protein [Bacteroidaceae bacterium]
MFEGCVYCRKLVAEAAIGTADYLKMYVGKTIDMKTRDRNWREEKSPRYGGKKIQYARTTYGVSDDCWETVILEKVFAETKDELKIKLKEAETKWIRQLDTVAKGFNGSYGDGNLGIEHNAERKRKDSIASTGRRKTEEQKAHLSKVMMGHPVSEKTRQLISKGNTGKKRTEAMNKAQSERMKGIEPKAATEGAEKWRKENGGSFWKGKQMPPESVEKMKLYQQAHGTKVLCHYPDGSQKEFSTMLDCEKATGVKAGSILNNLRTNGKGRTRDGYWFERI